MTRCEGALHAYRVSIQIQFTKTIIRFKLDWKNMDVRYFSETYVSFRAKVCDKIWDYFTLNKNGLGQFQKNT